MYILSQGKESLVNIRNVLAITIENKYPLNLTDFIIKARCVTDGSYILGEYNSRERAKQVFEEIMKQIGDTEKYLATTDMMLKNEDLVKEKERLGKLYGTDIILSDMRWNITPIKGTEKIYRMPEE